MSAPTLITISVDQKPTYLRLFTVITLQIGVIGIGVAVDSAAMQWCGFALLILFLFAYVVSFSNKKTAITIGEARVVLEELENNERSTPTGGRK